MALPQQEPLRVPTAADSPPLLSAPALPAPPAVVLEDVSAGYGTAEVLRSVTLTLAPGSMTAVLGPNGAGKTSLVRLLCGLLPPRGGRFELGGRPAAAVGRLERARWMAVVPQDLALPFDYRVLEVVLMGRAPHLGLLGLEGPADLARAEAALERLQLTGLASRSLGTLSGGERQRVLLARALAQDAPILLLDEPTAHLDPHFQIELLTVLADLNREGRTVVAVMHDLNQAARWFPQVAVLHAGAVRAFGTPAECLDPSLLAEVFGCRFERLEHHGLPVLLPAAGP